MKVYPGYPLSDPCKSLYHAVCQVGLTCVAVERESASSICIVYKDVIAILQIITNPESKTRVVCLFHYHGVKREIQMWKEVEKSPPLPEDEKQKTLLKCKISISKYAKVILLSNSFMRRSSSLEIRIVGDSVKYDEKEVARETFALIRLKGKTELRASLLLN